MNCIKVSEAAAKWNISARRVRILCEQPHCRRDAQGQSISDSWRCAKAKWCTFIRKKNPAKDYVPLLEQIDVLKARLNQSRPLTSAEAEAFCEVFLVENTYHSNLNRWHYFISVLKASTRLLMGTAEQGACLWICNLYKMDYLLLVSNLPTDAATMMLSMLTQKNKTQPQWSNSSEKRWLTVWGKCLMLWGNNW